MLTQHTVRASHVACNISSVTRIVGGACSSAAHTCLAAISGGVMTSHSGQQPHPPPPPLAPAAHVTKRRSSSSSKPFQRRCSSQTSGECLIRLSVCLSVAVSCLSLACPLVCLSLACLLVCLSLACLLVCLSLACLLVCPSVSTLYGAACLSSVICFMSIMDHQCFCFYLSIQAKQLGKIIFVCLSLLSCLSFYCQLCLPVMSQMLTVTFHSGSFSP